MSNQSEKIFVDLDEDITFVLERVRSVDASKVILVVPKSSNLTGSLISLKVLAKQLTKSDKLVVLATEDELGHSLAEKSKIVTVDNPGEISDSTWETVKEMKEEYKDELERKKRMLLERRDEKKGSDYKIIEEETKEVDLDDDESDDSEKEENDEEGDDEKEEEEVKSIRPTSRVPAKITTVGTIKFYSAGDVIDNEELLSELIPKDKKKRREEDEDDDDDRDDRDDGDSDDSDSNDDSKDKNDEEDDEEKVSRFQKRNLIGMDYANMVSNPRKRVGNNPNSGGPSQLSSIIETVKTKINSYLDTPKKKRYAMVALGIIFLLFFVTPVFGANATIDVTLKKDSLNINQKIKANPQVQGINVATFEIPAETRSMEDSASESGSATGQGVAGEKAEGVITVFNLTDNPVNIASGTKVTIISSNLVYITTAAVTVPPVTSGSEAPDVGIVATQPGESYNASGQKDFSIEGFAASSVKGKNFQAIQGGESEDIIVVSKEDIAALKDIVKKRLESTAVSKLQSLTAADELLLEETIQIEIVEETSSKKAGEESEEFDVTIKAKVSALFVKKLDIEEMAKEIARMNQEIEGESEINIAVFPEISDVKFEKGIATFTISSQASARASITEETLSTELSGKSIGDAEDYLSNQADIEKYKINYSPAFLPDFLKKIPSGDSLDIKLSK